MKATVSDRGFSSEAKLHPSTSKRCYLGKKTLPKESFGSKIINFSGYRYRTNDRPVVPSYHFPKALHGY